MKSFCVIGAASMCLLVFTPARAEVHYPTQPCRVFVDTDWIQIPNQCGTVLRWYSRRLLLPPVKRSSYHYGPYE
jgi:hypothetical protein